MIELYVQKIQALQIIIIFFVNFMNKFYLFIKLSYFNNKFVYLNKFSIYKTYFEKMNGVYNNSNPISNGIFIA